MKRWQAWAAVAAVIAGLAVVGWRWVRAEAPSPPSARTAKVVTPRPERVQESPHYRIATSATPEQTQAVADAMEALRRAYLDTMGVAAQGDGKLSLVLYKDRAEFQANNRSRPWAEAYYLAPHCYAYIGDGRNRYHWMLHEGVHQLNREVAGYTLPGWINEGLASYFGASRIVDGRLRPGDIDADTYPIWWLPELWLSGDRRADLADGTVLPLRTLMRSDRNDVNRRFNRYYIGYWSLSHFLFHYRDGRYASGYLELIRRGGSAEDFERLIGPIDRIEAEWYGYLQARVDALRHRPVPVAAVPTPETR